MADMTPATLDIGRRRARRWFAIVSFGFLILFATLVTATLLWSADRKDVAEALAGAGAAVTGIISTLTIIVLTYLGVSLGERLARKD